MNSPRDRPCRRYLLVTNGLARGGAETQTVRLALELVRRGHKVRLLSILPTQAFGDQIADASIEVHELNDVTSPRPSRLPATIFGAVAEVRRWRPDVIISFVYQANMLARVAGMFGRSVVISSVRNENFGGRLRDLSIKGTDRLAAATTTNSQRAAQRLVADHLVSAGRLHVIPNALDLDRFVDSAAAREATRRELGLADTTFVWLAVGRLVDQKDFPSLVRAVSLLDSPSPTSPTSRSVVLIAGEGPDHATLSAQIAGSGLADRVRLLGAREDIPALLGAADGLVLSSAWEGLPNVVMEAMAAARPVVATDVGGVRELIDDSCGVVVAPGDHVVLSEGMGNIESLSGEEQRRLGACGRARVAERFQTAVVVDKWEALAEGLMTDTIRNAGRR